MPNIVLRNREGVYFLGKANNWPAPWSRDTPPVVMFANIFGQVDFPCYYNRTGEWLDGMQLYTEVESVATEPYTPNPKESHAK